MTNPYLDPDNPYFQPDKNGKCTRKTKRGVGCPECPGYPVCNEKFQAMLNKISIVREMGLGYYTWEGNHHGYDYSKIMIEVRL